MDCCRPLTPLEKANRRNKKTIEKIINADKKKTIIRLLLLGAGESGKSTFIKQMHYTFNKGFSEKEIRGYIPIIYQNMFTSMQNMIQAMHDFKIDYDFPDIMEYVQLIRGINADSAIFDNLNVTALKNLWAFDGIQETYRQSNKYHLSDSTKYFFDKIDQVAAPDYVPDKDDILRVRVQTKGVIEYDFPSKSIDIRITDVGGQRAERMKWFNVFETCNAMIFISAISEYDQVLVEENKVNRFEESLSLFSQIINHHLFSRKGNVLFLNKNDLFEDKIIKSNFGDYFPEYDGQGKDVMAIKNFIKRMFTDKKEKTNIGHLYLFFTVAIDSDNIIKVFKSVKQSIINANLPQIE